MTKQIKKMSLLNATNSLSRQELQTIMAGSGSGSGNCQRCQRSSDCQNSNSICTNWIGSGPCGSGKFCW